ncbi:hypothetical protein [Hymenobacter crusticola]|uniref:Outer membrane protein beta-barrel domain-containing protein n=1 Tax=Hymenobacter crusticola TaxID=1770526 RepID=A0A243WCP7_9BACT|nr:hypothetical protein [Hymenobacter crusticola]OUJ73410.1 hypothetical protein BXP70_13420 [Hymenobacter crusticola]
MKKLYLLVTICGTSAAAHGQLNVAYHQSALPFASISYDFGRFHPDFRVGVDAFTSNLNPELTLNYKFVNKEDYYVYGGIGGRTNNLAGAVVPVGVVVFPFARKRLGFHTELAVIGIGENGTVLRGSWGVKFRFGRAEEGPGL